MRGAPGRDVVIIVRGCNVIDVGYVFDVRLDAQDLVEPDEHCRIHPRKARQEHSIVECGVHAAAMHHPQSQAQKRRQIIAVPYGNGVLWDLRHDCASTARRLLRG